MTQTLYAIGLQYHESPQLVLVQDYMPAGLGPFLSPDEGAAREKLAYFRKNFPRERYTLVVLTPEEFQ